MNTKSAGVVENKCDHSWHLLANQQCNPDLKECPACGSSAFGPFHAYEGATPEDQKHVVSCTRQLTCGLMLADTGEFYIEGDMLWCGDHGIARFVNSQSKANRKLLCSMLNSVSALTAECDSLRAVVDELAKALRAKMQMSNTAKPTKLEAAWTWRENDEKADRMARAALTKVGE